MCAGPSQGMPIMRGLCQRPRRCSQHCFTVTNSQPNELDSQLVCFFENQQTGALLRHAKNPVLDCLGRLSAAWSASTFAWIANPHLCGSGMFGGSSSFPCMCPNLLEVQSFLSKADLSVAGSLGSCTISASWCFFRHANTWKSWCVCPSLGSAR
jgi:hypothetical protein